MNCLKEIAKKIRINTLLQIAIAQTGHLGGSLSIVDIITVLYFEKMKIDPKSPKLKDRDRFILSKGHAAPALYATLAERGFFQKNELLNLRKYGSILQGHPDMKKTPGIDMSSGSLGQGLSIAVGMALGAKLDKKPYKIYVILGDGEVQEGQVWEAAMSATHYNLNNIIAILDYNKLQIDGSVKEVMNIDPIDKKFESFGWNVIAINGHDFEDIRKSIDRARCSIMKPTIIIACTIKGKGVSFMENNCQWHSTVPNKSQLEEALKELEGGV